MVTVDTRDEALGLLDRALTQWQTTAAGVMTQAIAVADSARSSAEAASRRWAAKAGAIEAALKSMGPDEDPGPLTRLLAEANRAQRTAQNASARIGQVSAGLAALQRSHVRQAQDQIASARADLARRMTEL